MVMKFLEGDTKGAAKIPDRCDPADQCTFLRSKPDSGKSSAEPDGQRGWPASSAATEMEPQNQERLAKAMKDFGIKLA